MEEYKPCAAMVVTQCIYAALALWSKAVFTGGMSPLVFVVYRQFVATIVLVPVVIAANRRKMKEMMGRLGITGFSLVFVASLVGATVNQCLYYQGVNLGSSSMATAMTNLIPAITFVMAASVGLERVDVRRPRGLAKIFGTAVCVSGAMAMAFFKGPKLLLGDLHALLLHSPAAAGGRWVTGALFLVGSSSCWSLWLILQVPICKSYVDPLALSAWMCLLSTLQSALLVAFLLPDPSAWRIHSLFDLSCCLFSGVFGSGVTFYLQSWSISVRGPLYSAMFNPLCTVITTVFAAAVLREELHVGRLQAHSKPLVRTSDGHLLSLQSPGSSARARTQTHSSARPNMADGGNRAGAEGYKPCAAMVATQCIFAAMTLWVKAAFGRGMSPMVFVVYRQAVATLVLAPIAIIANRARLKEMRLGMKAFLLVFMAALFGATANQNLCYQGLHLGTSSLATTMTNLIPAITFVMAVAVGQERVNIREVSSRAKILGTAVCVGGAITIAFFKGPKLPREFLSDPFMLLHEFSSDNWVMGALFLVGSSSCWSLWLILQGPICERYVDPLYLSAWTCFLSTLQSAVVALFLLPDRSAWKIHSLFELSCYVFAGVLGSGVVFYLQSWCISVRGPLYSAMFTPLCTVLTTALSAAILHEELHIGSLVGAAAVITGLYIVLWGKAEDARMGRMPPALSKADVEPHPHSHAQLDVENTLSAPLMAGTERAQAHN